MNIQDIFKTWDSVNLDLTYSDLDKTASAKYSYLINENWYANIGIEQRFPTKYDNKEEFIASTWLTYKFPVYDAKWKNIVNKWGKNVIINGDSVLTEKVFNFASESIRERVAAKWFKEEKLVKKPQEIEQEKVPDLAKQVEQKDSDLDKFNPSNLSIDVWDSYNIHLSNPSYKFTIKWTSWVISVDRWIIKWLKEWEVTVNVSDWKKTKHFKVRVKAPKAPWEGPTAIDDNVSTLENQSLNWIDVLANDKWNPTLTWSLSDQTGWKFEVVKGKINFTPTKWFIWEASARYEVKDSKWKTTWWKLRVDVQKAWGVEKPWQWPKLNNDSFTTYKNAPILWADVLWNDEKWSELTWNTRNLNNCKVEIKGGKVNIYPNEGFVWPFSFQYEAKLNWKTSWATVSVTITDIWDAPQQPESSFSSGSVNKKVWDSSFTNRFTTNSTWAIIYTSDNPSVAVVDNTWKVSIVWEWSARITASQSATPTHLADVDSYTVKVDKEDENVDRIAPSKVSESFPNLETKGFVFQGSMTFDEEIADVIAISITGGYNGEVSCNLIF